MGLVFPPNHFPVLVVPHRPDLVFPPKLKSKPPETEKIRSISDNLSAKLACIPVPRQDSQMLYELATLRQSLTDLLSLQSSLHLGPKQQQQSNK